MKLSKVLVSTVFLLALSAVAYAGPHNFGTMFTSNDINLVGMDNPNDNQAVSFGAVLDWPRSASPANPSFLLGSFAYVTFKDSNDGTNYNPNADLFFLVPVANKQNCDENGNNPTGANQSGFYCQQDLPFTTGATNAADFAFVQNAIFDANGGTITQSVISLTYGDQSYFWAADDGTGSGVTIGENTYNKPQDFNLFLELDIRVEALAPYLIYTDPDNSANNLYSPGTPGGIWRMGWGINGNVSSVGLSTLNPQTPGRSPNGDFLVSGTLGGCAQGEQDCERSFTLLDAEFTPDEGSPVPEPTTMLLLGSGLIAVARRFRR